jgi:hypothetical protein
MTPGILFVAPAIVSGAVVFGLYRGSGLYDANTPLRGLILQDGIHYFVVAFGTNIVWILMHVLEVNKVVTVSPPRVVLSLLLTVDKL